jgi:xylose isomerase
MKYFRDPVPAFRWYEPRRVVQGKTMEEQLRFAMCYWHTMRGSGGDPFGLPTMRRAWTTPRETMDAAFELMTALGIKYWTFHDRDIAEIDDVPFAEGVKRLEEMVQYAEQKQRETGIRCLWGTAGLFAHPRYMSGAATNPDPHVFAYAAAQVKHALEATHALGGAGYVFWGGREGYETLLNTDMKREREQYARFLSMAADHAQSIGFQGQLYIEPKPKEPTTHQYDSDAEACLNFLREFGLLGVLKLNIETNHATLAGHTMVHELRVAREAGALGSIDANVGDELLGWDTDQFMTDPWGATLIMLEVLRMGGFTTGGLNFDAKVRRQSVDPADLMHAHVGSMDAFARGLMIADAIQQDGRLDAFVRDRYAGWGGDDAMFATLAECEAFVRKRGEPPLRSGRQEWLESLMREISDGLRS